MLFGEGYFSLERLGIKIEIIKIKNYISSPKLSWNFGIQLAKMRLANM